MKVLWRGMEVSSNDKEKETRSKSLQLENGGKKSAWEPSSELWNPSFSENLTMYWHHFFFVNATLLWSKYFLLRKLQSGA